MARHDLLYRRALYYDIALARDVTRETEFLLAVFQNHAPHPLRSVLEIGCGPGYHARALARKGLAVSALDISEPMIELARSYAALEDVSVHWMVADMRVFDLDEPVDMAVCLFDGIDALLTDSEYEEHFAAVSANLSENGLYVVDCTHPRDCSLANYGAYRYTGERDGIDVEIQWGTNSPVIDPVTGIAEVATSMRVKENGDELVIEDIARERCLTAQELRMLAEYSGHFRVAEWYGGFDINQPFDTSPASDRMIVVLRKRSF
jgi:SAM-dependent methyltransferase